MDETQGTPDLGRLVAEVTVLAGAQHQCTALGHLWSVEGGRALGRVVGHDCREGHRVIWDQWPEPFGAIHGAEFVAVAEDSGPNG